MLRVLAVPISAYIAIPITAYCIGFAQGYLSNNPSPTIQAFQNPVQKPIMAHSEISPIAAPQLQDGGGPLISDVIPRSQQIGIFAGLTREVSLVSSRLESGTSNATVLAPTDAFMKQLARRPWENAEDYNTFGADAYEGGEGQDRAQKNLERFVGAHIVPTSPWEANDKVKTLAGNEIWYEMEGEAKVIQPMGIKVVETAEKVANGEVWILDGILNPVQDT